MNPSSPLSGGTTRGLSITVLLAAAALGGCRGPGDSWAAASFAPGTVRPTLEEVFLEPPISGVAPRAEEFSADGEWLLLRWTPPPAAGVPDETEEGGPPPPRLLCVADPAATDHRGRPLDEILPPLEEPRRIAHAVWSHRGHRLAVSRGRRIWLFDPTTDDLVELIDPGPATEEEGAEEEEHAPLRVEGRIRQLTFAPGDRALRFADDRELYTLLLPAAEWPAAHVPLARLASPSANVAAPAHRLQWSDDLSVAFGADPTPFDAPGPGTDEADAPPPRQVLHVARGTAVELAGMAEMDSLEGHRLSPDGRFVFAQQVDHSREPPPTLVPDYLTERVTTRTGRRLLAEDLPSPRVLWMWNTKTGERKAIAPFLPVSAETEETPPVFWVRSIGWAPQPTEDAPARFAFSSVASDYRDGELWCWTEGACTRVWSEHDDRWLGGPTRGARWSRDGRVLLIGSEGVEGTTTPGRAQLFAVDVESGEVRQLTEVEGEVSRFVSLTAGDVIIEASRTDPGRREIGRLAADVVRGEREGDVQWFPAPAGWNTSPRAAADGARIVFSHETLGKPPELYTADLEEAAPLTRTIPRAFEQIEWVRPVLFTIPSPDGPTIRAHVYLPPGVALDADAPRATVVFVHGAGYLQNVSDSMTRYPLNLMFHSRLARMGYPVIDVDYRGSAGYGRDFRTDVQYHLGGKDLDDIHLVVDALVARGLVDPARVGIYGGSYGGFMTLMALFTAPERWAAGAALRSVTDWRTYHPTYTQPRLGRPSTHAEAYALSSPIDHVEGLEDPLLILHGMVDSNVFAQDSIRLIEELIDLGRDFDAMLYPSQGHGFTDGPHWLDEYRRIESHFLRHLGPPQR